MIPIRNAADAQAQALWRITLATTHPDSICTVPSLTTRYAKCLTFSVCVLQQNRLSRPPIAVIYSPATRQTRPLPSGVSSLLPSTSRTCDGGLWNREANKYLHWRWKQHIPPQSVLIHQATSRHIPEGIFLLPPSLQESGFLMISWHPSKEMYQLPIHFLVKQNFMATSWSTCLPQSGVWNQCNKLLASTHKSKTVSFALSEIHLKKKKKKEVIVSFFSNKQSHFRTK